MTNAKRLVLSMCIAFCGSIAQGHATESRDSVQKTPAIDLHDKLFYDMCIHSAPAQDTADAESVDSGSENRSAPPVGGHAL